MEGMRQKGLWFRLLSLATLVTATTLLFILAHYSGQTHLYAARAARGAQQAVPPPSDNEVIIVFTGDRGRVAAGIDLLHQRSAKWLILSGVYQNAPLTDILQEQLKNQSLEPSLEEKIIVEDRSTSTTLNALHSADLLGLYKPDQVILVTSDYHMPRARYIFQKRLAYTVYPYAVSSDFSNMWLQQQSLSPAALWTLGVESLKFALYHLSLA